MKEVTSSGKIPAEMEIAIERNAHCPESLSKTF